MLDRSLPLTQRRPKCCFCLNLETGCFIFGVFSSVLSGASLLVLCFLLSTVNNRIRALVEDLPGADEAQYELVQHRALNLVIGFLGVTFLYIYAVVSFIFSVFLCYGVHKRRAGFVKIYLVYGILLTTMLMMGAAVYSWLQQDLVGGSFVLIGCGIYSLLLLMVQRTYEEIRGSGRLSPLHDEIPYMKA